MLVDIIDALACPVCMGDVFLADPGMVRCGAGHSYDVARHGYVNMLSGDAKAGTADTAAMIESRQEFISRGHFTPIADAVAEAVEELVSDVEGCIVDAGAGTGYHLATVLRRLGDRQGAALDISKYAARKAARAHPRIGAVVCDTWQGLPVRSGAAAALLDVFAPRNPAEFSRVLAPGGALIVVTPGARHLGEISEALGFIAVDDRKDERIEEAFSGLFERLDERRSRFKIGLSRDEVLALAAMGPTSRHVSEQESEHRVANLPERTEVTVCVKVGVFRRADTLRAARPDSNR